jgi:hypothetical protein
MWSLGTRTKAQLSDPTVVCIQMHFMRVPAYQVCPSGICLAGAGDRLPEVPELPPFTPKVA